jgi:hypothetical protein
MSRQAEEILGVWLTESAKNPHVMAGEYPSISDELDRLFKSQRDLPATICKMIGTATRAEDFASNTHAATAGWDCLANRLVTEGRVFEALSLYYALYERMLQMQLDLDARFHKGIPLVRIADLYRQLKFAAHEEHYLMLTLCEDAVRGEGVVSPNDTGIYFRLVWLCGFSDMQIHRYAREINDAALKDPQGAFFPEALLLHLDRRWHLAVPTHVELGTYRASATFIRHQLSKLSQNRGKELEKLAEYLLSCMPGCRTQCRVASNVTEYDIVCSMNGAYYDFRSEFGRYFVCECKDWKETAGISVISKFCRIMDSTKVRFGILFSRKGISGMSDSKFAAREQQKIFQDRGIVIVVVDETDLNGLADGDNFVLMLRAKYEAVRLDLGVE